MNHRDTPSENTGGNDGSDALLHGSLESGLAGQEPVLIEQVGLNARVLAVSPRRSVRRRISSMLHGKVESLEFVDSAREALEYINTSSTDLVIIERALEKGDGIELLETITTHHPMMVGVVLGAIHGADDAVRAMRAGACDLIPMGGKGTDTMRRIVEAVERAQRVRRRDARVDRLKKLCSKLNNAREEVSGQIGGLCTDLTEAYKDLTQQFGDVKVTSELETLLRQELDIESLLRTLLEFTLSKIGPTNAAVFMPTSGGDYSVGAYVNYDIARETAEIMLDQLA
ncbi:MAG: response regulator, partial [Phycisphaerales bacterium]|nr:response regulator [Phycisphaerales bacterium]